MRTSSSERKTKLSPAKQLLLEKRLRGENAEAGTLQQIALSLRPERLPLSHAQQRLWFIDRLEGTTARFNLSGTLRLRGELDAEALERAINTIVERHEGLRTHFADVEGEPVQVIEAERRIEIPVEDLSGLEEGARQECVKAAMRREGEEAFDLASGPMLRVRLLKLGEQEHILLRTMHHIVSDGWSQGVFNREFMVLYEAYREGRENPLKPLSVQYADFAIWQRKWLKEGGLQHGLGYWKKQLEGIPEEMALPLDRPRPQRQTFSGQVYRLVFPAEVLTALKQLAQKNQATLYMTLLTAFTVLLSRYCGQEDIVVGSPIANRQEARLEELIGFFVNTLVMRVRVTREMTLRELLEAVRRTALEAYRHQDVPFERLVEELSPRRSLNRTPVFQVTLAVHNAPGEAQRLKGLQVEGIGGTELRIHFDLEIDIWEREGQLQLFWMYNRDLFDGWRMKQMGRHYARVLEAMILDLDQPIRRVDVLTVAERQEILVEKNRTARAVGGKTLAGLFEEQVERTPEAVAVVYEEGQVSYDELNRMANRLAHMLIADGIGPEDVVGLAVPRSVEMIVGLLGILKAGAVYLPLDAEYPAARLALMVEDAAPRCVLTTSQVAGDLPESWTCLVLDADETQDELRRRPANNLENRKDGRQLKEESAAYVIYTSGSTGRPKGVVVAHSAIVNKVSTLNEYLGICRETRFAATTSISFDPLLDQIFCPLVAGGTCVIVPDSIRESADEFIRYAERHRIAVLNGTPMMMEHLLSCQEDGMSLDTLILGGDVVYPRQAKEFRERGVAGRLLNFYGPTETCINACGYEIGEIAEGASVPIGSALPNYRVYVLDGNLEPVPAGVNGELYVAGAGVARGYVNKPGQTGERFVADPYGEGGQRMYRTGDVVKWNGEGALGFVGRVDQQVKVRGFRIELGEIEEVLRGQERVQDAVVVVKGEGQEKRLVGYVVAEQGGNLDSHDLLRHLKQVLPSYSVPAMIAVLDTLPVLPNGKVDRKALLEVESFVARDVPFAPPEDQMQKAIAAIWQKLLQVEQVSIFDNFFDLGGHSFLLFRMHREVQKLTDRPLLLTDLFQYPTVFSLAKYLISGGQVPDQQDSNELEKLKQANAQRKQRFEKRILSR